MDNRAKHPDHHFEPRAPRARFRADRERDLRLCFFEIDSHSGGAKSQVGCELELTRSPKAEWRDDGHTTFTCKTVV